MCSYNSAVVWAVDTHLCLDGVATYYVEEVTTFYGKVNSSCCKNPTKYVVSLICLRINRLFHVINTVCFATPGLWHVLS